MSLIIFRTVIRSSCRVIDRLMKQSFLGIAIILFSVHAQAQSHWCLWHEQPTSRDLHAISVVTPTNVWAVGGNTGDGGRILHFNGANWYLFAQVTLPIYAIDMVSANEGWAVGATGQILRYVSGSWQTVPSPTSKRLYAIKMIDADDGYIVGQSGTILRYRDGSWIRLHEEDGELTTRDLRAVSVVDANNIWIVGGDAGDSGRIVYCDNSRCVFYDYADAPLHAVAMTSSGSGWAAGEGGLIARYENGIWSSTDSPTTRTLRSISAVSRHEIWAVGGDPENPRLLRYDGETWQAMFSPTSGILYGVAATPTDAWAVGASGTLLRRNLAEGLETIYAEMRPDGSVGPSWVWPISDAFDVFNESQLNFYEIEISPADWGRIIAGDRNTWFRANLHWGTVPRGRGFWRVEGELRDVGIRGSFNTSHDPRYQKPSFRFSVREFGHSSRRWYGLDRLKLDGMIFDRTYMRDRMAYWFYRQGGVPAPRSVHALVRINGAPWMVYSVEEVIRKPFLRSRFPNGDRGNLYSIQSWNQPPPHTYDWRGENIIDYVASASILSSRGPFTVEETAPGRIEPPYNIYSDVREFVRVLSFPCGENPSVCRSRLDERTNAEGLFRYLAVHQSIVEEDALVPPHGDRHANNHFWYNDNNDAGKLHVIAWDPDQAFSHTAFGDYPLGQIRGWDISIWRGLNHIALTRWIREDSAASEELKQRIRELIRGPMRTDVAQARLDAIYNQIREHVYNDPHIHESMRNGGFDRAYQSLREWFTRRAPNVEQQLTR